MTTGATIGYGTILKKGNGGSPESFTDYGLEITNITPPSLTRDDIEATSMQSADRFKEYVPGMYEGGEVPVEVNWIPSNTAAMQTLMEAGTVNWQMLIDSTTCTYAAYIKGLAIGGLTPDGKKTATFTFKITGRPVWA